MSGRVLGITVEHEGTVLNIRALKGVLVATGGHSNNIEFRRMFDPRLTEEYRVTGDPYSRKTADGEIAAMALGASLWGTAQQTNEAARYNLMKAASIGGEFVSQAFALAGRQPDLRQDSRNGSAGTRLVERDTRDSGRRALVRRDRERLRLSGCRDGIARPAG